MLTAHDALAVHAALLVVGAGVVHHAAVVVVGAPHHLGAFLHQSLLSDLKASTRVPGVVKDTTKATMVTRRGRSSVVVVVMMRVITIMKMRAMTREMMLMMVVVVVIVVVMMTTKMMMVMSQRVCGNGCTRNLVTQQRVNPKKCLLRNANKQTNQQTQRLNKPTLTTTSVGRLGCHRRDSVSAEKSQQANQQRKRLNRQTNKHSQT